MSDLVGQTIDRYQILTLLGEGGMGAVYKAHDITLLRDVAMKVLHTQFARQPDFRERFLQEARTAARLNHPSIVQVHDFGQQGDMLYIVMEFIPGANLSQMLNDLREKGQWLRLDETLELLRQVCLALDYAHRQGVLHRDIKPGNIMLKPEPSEGLPYRPVVTDLGLAKLLEGQGITQEGTSMGTPAYMSPEQALGQKVDARSDVYSLGILLYELCVGKLPFPAKTLSEAIRYHTQEPPPPPRALRPDLPLLVEKVILRAIEKDPARRPANAAELAQGLKTIAPALDKANLASTVLGDAVSLVTQYQSSLEPRGPSVMNDFEPPSDLTQDRIQVLSQDQTSRSMAIPRAGMVIGRDADCDLPLNDRKASRKHARLEVDGAQYKITDLNSSNGTFLSSTKLLPGVSEIWTPDKPLRIGDTWLRLAPAQAARSGMAFTRPDGSLIDPAQVHSSPGQATVSLYAEPTALQVEPGRPVILSVTLFNQGNIVDHFRLSLRGLPESWTPNLPAPVQLMPGTQQQVTLAIQPPRSPQSRAGDYAFSLHADSQNNPSEAVELKLKLTVGAYSQFRSDFHPERIIVGKAARVTVENLGNQREVYRLGWRDRAEEIAFTPPQAQLAVREGQSASAEFQAAPRARRLLGGAQTHAITVQISSPGGETQTHSGEVVSRAILPGWAAPVLLGLCLLLAVAAALIGYPLLKPPVQVQANTTQTAEAYVAQEVARLSTEQAAPLLTRTAEAFQSQETQKAAAQAGIQTATAAASTALAEGDADGDGLSQSREAALGTDPNNPDTDGDGLSDGAEVNQYGTLPIVRDSDKDNLSDGDEIALGANPLNSDTDGDGLLDNVDPDPLHIPTPTPKPPPDGVSMNCDGSYQRFRFEDLGAQGRVAYVDNWIDASWVPAWKFEGGDPMERQIEVAGAGMQPFGPCQYQVILPLRYSGSGASLDVLVFAWNGSTLQQALSVTGLTHGNWEKSGDSIFTTYSVYLYNEPNCCPCNTEKAEYRWNSGIFGYVNASLSPTYSGDPPAQCVASVAQPTLSILVFRPQWIITPMPIIITP